MGDNKFDGLLVAPGGVKDTIIVSFFMFRDEKYRGNSIENTGIGDRFHVALFKKTKDGTLKLDDIFEAIFSDPLTYIRNLVPLGFYGTFVRKTENSKFWFDNYTKRLLNGQEIDTDCQIQQTPV